MDTKVRAGWGLPSTSSPHKQYLQVPHSHLSCNREIIPAKKARLGARRENPKVQRRTQDLGHSSIMGSPLMRAADMEWIWLQRESVYAVWHPCHDGIVMWNHEPKLTLSEFITFIKHLGIGMITNQQLSRYSLNSPLIFLYYLALKSHGVVHLAYFTSSAEVGYISNSQYFSQCLSLY